MEERECVRVCVFVFIREREREGEAEGGERGERREIMDLPEPATLRRSHL